MSQQLATLTDQVLSLMGRQAGPGLVTDNVRLAVDCLSRWFGVTDAASLKSYIDGIDLNTRAERITLTPPKSLIGYRRSSEAAFHGGQNFNMFGMYFTDPGVSKFDVGVNTNDRRFLRYELRRPTPALKSRAASGFISGMGMVQGGATQYIIPDAGSVLSVRHVQHSIR